MAMVQKVLSVAGLVVSGLASLVVSLQGLSVWQGGPPHWMAVAATVLGVASTLIAKALDFFKPAAPAAPPSP